MARKVVGNLDCLLSGTGPTSPVEQTPNRHVPSLRSRASAFRSQNGGGEQQLVTGLGHQPRLAKRSPGQAEILGGMGAADGR